MSVIDEICNFLKDKESKIEIGASLLEKNKISVGSFEKELSSDDTASIQKEIEGIKQNLNKVISSINEIFGEKFEQLE